MKPLFDQYNIEVVALSKDTPEQVQSHIERDGLTITLLSDPKLNVIKDFGLLHQKAIQFKTVDVLGVPLGVPSGFPTMAIPTTLIIDEGGIVRWIDQADDYRMRGDEARVRGAVENAFAAD